MTTGPFSDVELLAYFDEALGAERMAVIEQALRGDGALRQRAAVLARRRDQGGHSVGEIWRRARASCPTRHQLGSYLLEALSPEQADYLQFHLEIAGCRYCQANLQDLQEATPTAAEAGRRRRKFFESSAGQIRRLSGS